VECFKVGEKLSAEGLDMRTKGEGSVKSNTEELEGGFECNGCASQSELGLMRGLVGVCAEEATFIFSGVDWKAPFQGPFFKLAKGLLNSMGSFQQVGGGKPDGEIINIE